MPNTSHLLLRNALLACVYALTGKLALLLAIPPGYATAVFPPAGIALAAVFVFGWRILPGVLIGSFLLNFWSEWEHASFIAANTHWLTPLEIGTGAALQAYVGAYALRHFTDQRNNFDQLQPILLLFFVVVPLSCLVNALLGNWVLVQNGLAPAGQLALSTFTWWAGDTIGALLFAPITLAFIAEPRAAWRARRTIISLPLLLTMIAIVALFNRANEWEAQQLRYETQRAVDTVANRLSDQMSSAVDILLSLERLFAASQSVDRSTFQIFVARAIAEHPELRAIEWIPRVSHGDRVAFETKMQTEGFPQFAIVERDVAGQMVSAAARNEYFPVTYLEPMDGNALALGYDVGSEAVRRSAIDIARQSGMPAATEQIQLAQEPSNHSGLLVFVPVFHSTNTNLAPAALAGFATGVFALDELVARALTTINRADFSLRIYPPTQQDQPWVADSQDAQNDPRILHDYAQYANVSLANKPLTVEISPSGHFVSQHDAAQAWYVLFGGAIFSTLLGAFLLVISSQTSRVTFLVAQTTQALHRSNRILSAVGTAQTQFIARTPQAKVFGNLATQAMEVTQSEVAIVLALSANQQTAVFQLVATVVEPNTSVEHDIEFVAPAGGNLLNFAMEHTERPMWFGNANGLPRASGLPVSLPSVNNALILPLHRGNALVGLLILGNLKAPASTELINECLPLATTLATLVAAQRVREAHARAILALQESESRLLAVFANAGDGIITLDRYGCIESANPAAERVLGLKQTEIAGKFFSSFLAPNCRQSVDALMENMSNQPTTQKLSVSIETKNRTAMPAELILNQTKIDSRLMITAFLHI